MALVVLPEGQQRSGAIGGTVWSHNRSCVYIRNRSIPVNPNTDRQVDVRNAVRALSIRWETVLTQLQRDAWDTYAANVSWMNRLGQTIHLTGLNHYVRSNTNLQIFSIAVQDAAPVIFDIAAAEATLGCAASEATQVYTITFDDTAAWASEDNAYQFFFAGLPQNGSRKFFGGPWRYLHALNGSVAAPQVSPAVVPAGNTPWPFAQGQRLWLRSRILRADGRLSQFARINFLAAA